MTLTSKQETYRVTIEDLKKILAKELNVKPEKVKVSFFQEHGRIDPPEEIYRISYIDVRVDGI